MSHAIGKRTHEAIINFIQSVQNPFPQMAEKLETEFLNAADLNHARNYVKAMREVTPIPGLNIDTIDEPDHLQLCSIYMTVAQDERQPTPDFDTYVPIINDIGVAPHYVFNSHRPMPVQFASERIETAFIRNGLPPLNYNDQHFIHSVAVALAMTRQIPEIMDVERLEKFMPVAVPHEHGLFFGSAIRCAPEKFMPQELTVALRADNPPECRRVDASTMDKSMWTPEAYINFHSFVPVNDFTSAQDDLHDMFCETVLGARGADRNFGIFINTYAASEYAKDPTKYPRALKAIDTNMTKVLTSPLWHSVTTAKPKAFYN